MQLTGNVDVGAEFEHDNADELVEVSTQTMNSNLYYVRYYSGHTGRYGNQFLQFQLKEDGTLKYANNSHYRNENIIKKQARIAPAVLDEIKRLIVSSSICESNDEL